MLMLPFRGVRNQCSSAAQHGGAANAQFSVHEGFLRCFTRCAAINLAKIVRTLQAGQGVLSFAYVEVGARQHGWSACLPPTV